MVGYGPGGRRETAQPSEIKLYVEPEALNQEHNAQNHSNFGFGWHPMNLRVGHQENVSQFSGDVRRQHFSLFASDKTEKHAWHIEVAMRGGALQRRRRHARRTPRGHDDAR